MTDIESMYSAPVMYIVMWKDLNKRKEENAYIFSDVRSMRAFRDFLKTVSNYVYLSTDYVTLPLSKEASNVLSILQRAAGHVA